MNKKLMKYYGNSHKYLKKQWKNYNKVWTNIKSNQKV